MLIIPLFACGSDVLPRRPSPPTGIGRATGIAVGLVATLVAIGGTQLCAQDIDVVELHPLKATDTSSPRMTLTSFIDVCSELYRRFYRESRSIRNEAERQVLVSRALRCLDLSEVPVSMSRNVGKERGILLKEVLDRIELPPDDTWPDSEQVAENHIESGADTFIARWTIPNTEITLAKIEGGPRDGEFLFTAETVDRAADFYEIVKDLPYTDRETVTPGLYQYFLSEPGWMLPRSWIRALPLWTHARWGGQAVWQWISLSITLISAFGLMLAIYILGRWRANAFRSNVLRYLITLAFPIAAMIVPLTAIYFSSEHIRISGLVLLVTSFALRLVFLFALIVVLLGAGSRIAALVIATPWVRPKGLDAQLVQLICRVVSIVAAVVVFLEGGRQFGIPLTTLLASAGVGGLALALAAQDTLKNVLGSIMITLDKPYQVGERIVTKGYDGFVEEIGLRSTKIRLLTGHQASIPNEVMAISDIENIGRRPYIRRTATIQMPSTAPVAKVNRALEIVRDALEDHEGMREEFPPRVYLRDINDASIGIFLIYWFHPPNYWDFLAFSEKVNVQVMEQFETEQIPFARPFLTIHKADAR